MITSKSKYEKMKKELFLVSFLALLTCPCVGCGDSASDTVEERPSAVGAATDMVVYEANPRVFANENAFASIKDNLARLKSLGVTVLWLMPVNEPGVERSVGSPYCIKDYYKLNSKYGSEKELKDMVDAAHEMGMKVLMDWVANHTSWDNAWITEHPDWYTHDDNGDIISPEGQPWTDVADLDYDNADMRQAMKEAMAYWVTAVGIDGFRCDYAEGVPDDFWKEVIGELRKADADIIMLAEGGKASLTDDGFNLVYGWDFQSKLKNVYAGNSKVSDVYDVNEQELSGMASGALRLRYSTNHDQAGEESPVECYGGESGAMSAFVLAAMLEGVPLIYSSQEVAFPEKLNFFDYQLVDFSSNTDFTKEMAAVTTAYKQTADVRSGTLKTYSTGDVATFGRKNGEKSMLVMVNTSNKEVEIKVPMDYAGLAMMDVIKNTSVKLRTTMILQPYEYHVFTK